MLPTVLPYVLDDPGSPDHCIVLIRLKRSANRFFSPAICSIWTLYEPKAFLKKSDSSMWPTRVYYENRILSGPHGISLFKLTPPEPTTAHSSSCNSLRILNPDTSVLTWYTMLLTIPLFYNTTMEFKKSLTIFFCASSREQTHTADELYTVDMKHIRHDKWKNL